MRHSWILAGLLATISVPASAVELIVGSGWQSDQLDNAGEPTQNSPWTFTLTGTGRLLLTDAFNLGDTYTVSGDFAVVSAVGAGGAIPASDAFADAAWFSGNYSIIDYALGAGSYSVSITGDGAGGLPAGLYVQVLEDGGAVPEPASWALMMGGFGLVGFAARRRGTMPSVSA
jgi:hypothetical protein